jgi:hypothetical protein
MNKLFAVQKTDLHQSRFFDIGLPPGGTVLRVEHFALTANNITYAAFGEAMKYWNFFPAPEAGWGVIPVWGFGTVEHTNAEGIAVGERFYGYFPFASHVAVEPTQIGATAFIDGAAHRQPMARIYNQYVRTAADPLYTRDGEAEQILLRPLFTTAFVIDDMLADNAYYGARAVILSSASSKTSYATAFLLARRGDVEVIGLTSTSNAAFVKSLGCYNRVVTYDELAAIPASLPVTYVDMAGNAGLRAAIHHYFGDALKYDCAVGATNWDADRSMSGQPLPGPKTQMFFAPTQAAKRNADWGAAGFQQKLGEAWHAFLTRATAPQNPWLKVVRATGADAAAQTYQDVLAGRAAPAEGHVLSLSQS